MKLTPEQVHAVNSAPSLRLLYALHLASLGMKIIPLKPGLKTPADSGWPEQATSDPQVIENWFETRSNINYGITCGQSGLLVVDLDIKKGDDGVANWRELSANLNLKTFEVETPSGGVHQYFWGSGLRNSAGTIARGVDLRASGGYVVGPGSTTPEGTYFSGLPWHFPDIREIQTASEPLLNLLRSRRGVGSLEASGVLTAPGVPVSTHVSKAQAESLGRKLVDVLNAQPGSRNETLNRAAFGIGALIREGAITNLSAQNLLLNVSKEVGLLASEALATIESGLKAGIELADPVKAASSKYEPLDILAWLSEDHPSPETFASGGILYKPGLIWVMGEPASGKSFLCLQWALDVINLGQAVVWIDEEAGPGDTLSKLKALGASETLLAKHFLYLQPEARHLERESEELHAFIVMSKPGLIVMDSAAAILANAGIDEDKNSPVVQFMNRALLPLVKELEVTTVVIDHKTKNKSNSNYARGASSKLGVVDMALNVELKDGFSKAKSGSFDVKVNKDRFGVHAKDTSWRVNVNVGADIVQLVFGEGIQTTDKASLNDGELQIRILAFIKANPGCSKSAIEEGVKGARTDRKRSALEELLASRRVLQSAIGSKRGFMVNEGATNE
jgi:archaellum biogenesis ATPase FlaH